MPRYRNQSAERLFALLECVGATADPLALADIARATGINRATAYRLLAVLTQLGYVHKDARSGTYTLGYRLFALGRRQSQLDVMTRRAAPFLRRLAWDVGCVVHLGALEGDRIVYCERIEPPDAPPVPTAPGMRLDAHATSIGKAALAWLPEDEVRQLYRDQPLTRHTRATLASRDALLTALRDIRANGYAVDRGEMIPGLACVGAPIVNSLGRAVTALSVALPVASLTAVHVTRLGARVCAAANEIADYLIHRDDADS